MTGQDVNLTMSSDLQMQRLENTALDLAVKSSIQAMVQEWQLEIVFLITKLGLLIKLIKRSRYSNPCPTLKKEQYEKELLQLVDQDLWMFQIRVKRILEEWKTNKFPDQTSLVAGLKEFRMLRRKWQELKSEQHELEIQILEALITNYPTKIF